jgi:hypothetical protein
MREFLPNPDGNQPRKAKRKNGRQPFSHRPFFIRSGEPQVTA